MATLIRRFGITYMICIFYSLSQTVTASSMQSQLLLPNSTELISNDSEHLSNAKNSGFVADYDLNFTTSSIGYLGNQRDNDDFNSSYGNSEAVQAGETSNSSENRTDVETSFEMFSDNFRECGDKCLSNESSETKRNDNFINKRSQSLEHEIKLLNKSTLNDYIHTKYTDVLKNISSVIKKGPSENLNSDLQGSSYADSKEIFNAENTSVSDMSLTTEGMPGDIFTKVVFSAYSAAKKSLENNRRRGRGNSSSQGRPSSAIGRIGLPHTDWPVNNLDKAENKDSSITPSSLITDIPSSTLYSSIANISSPISSSPVYEISSSPIEDSQSAPYKLTEEEINEYVNQMRTGRAAVVFNDHALDNDIDRCETSTGSRGRCKPLMECEEVLNNLRKVYPVICRWINDMPVVCCPQAIGSRTLNTPACGVRPIPAGMSSSRKRVYRQVARMPAEFALPATVYDNKNTLIVGGKESVLGAWPWMAGIYTRNFNVENFFCGAAIINEYYLVTAAHCFNTRGTGARVSAARYAIRVGSNKVRDGTRYLIDQITIHPDYIPREYYNDIAVIRLKEPLEFGNTVQPICLPISQEFRRRLVGRNVTVVGWGDQDFGGKRGEFLRDVTVPIIDLSTCDQAYLDKRGSSIPRGISRQFLCAGVEEGGKDACQRDSGGPLMLNEKGVWFLIGVVSFGFRCGEPGVPGVYTRITHYMDFLQNATSDIN